MLLPHLARCVLRRSSFFLLGHDTGMQILHLILLAFRVAYPELSGYQHASMSTLTQRLHHGDSALG